MLEEFVLHIGTHKTGTTSIQRALENEAEALKAQGITYPSSRTEPAGHPELAWSLRDGDGRRAQAETAENLVAEFLDEAARDGSERLLVSSEEFWLIPEDAIQRLKQLVPAKRYKIIAFFRRQDTFLEATFNQNVRQYSTREGGSLFEFYLRHNYHIWLNYHTNIHKWVQVFGKNAVSVRAYEAASKSDKGLMNTCFDLMGLTLNTDGSQDDKEYKWENKSLSTLSIIALARLNRLNNLTQPEHSRLLQELESLDRENAQQKFRLLLPNERAVLVNNYAATNAQMFKNLGIESDQDAWKWDQSKEREYGRPTPRDLSELLVNLKPKFPDVNFGAI